MRRFSEPPIIHEILSDLFGETDIVRIRLRRAHRLLQVCCGHLRAFAEALSSRDRERAFDAINGFGFSFKHAIPPLRIGIGDDATKHYATDFDALLGRILGPCEVEVAGRAGGRVRHGIVPFHERLPDGLWRPFLDQHGGRLARLVTRQADRLERLMREVWPAPGTSQAGGSRGSSRSRRRRDPPSATIAKAKGLLATNPEWTNSRLAKALGVTRETLSRAPYRDELGRFRKDIERVAAGRRAIDPDGHMGDDEWRAMHVR